MKKLLLFVFMIPCLAMTQEKGVIFEHGTSWEKVKAKAKTLNKYIFVDCFTTWCAPCKFMTEKIFPQEQVGAFFNANFVNLKLQMDQTASDNEEVKSWYAEAKRFESEYSVAAYPTFLIFNPQGELVHRIIGGEEDSNRFIEQTKMGLDPATQQAHLINKFEANPKDTTLAKQVMRMGIDNYDQNLARKGIQAYIDVAGVAPLFTKQNIDLLLKTTNASQSPNFKLIYDNREQIDQLTKPGTADGILGHILLREYVLPKMDKPGDNVDFMALEQAAKKDYPAVNMTEAMLFTKVKYYVERENWTAYTAVVNKAISANIAEVLQPKMLDFLAMYIYAGCDDPVCIK
ncbi:thioredoxin family protein [Sphingobacterium sp. CZ-UAM]|uniref:thioredoxin family protein n=1 Tax=Sphingobacterium sp. CZ-UAM TaxID=1933868 RepID=UPI00158BF15E|nr:thioredoxin fold domain-containing protein [Sphingobacterium sp. CZ-UAM]